MAVSKDGAAGAHLLSRAHRGSEGYEVGHHENGGGLHQARGHHERLEVLELGRLNPTVRLHQ